MISIQRLFSRASVTAIFTLLLFGCGKQEESQPQAADASPQMDARARSLQTTASVDDTHPPGLPPFRQPREFKPRPTLNTTDPTSTNYIREWNWFTTVGDYQRFGRTNPAWDADAIEALEHYCDVCTFKHSGKNLNDSQKRAGDAAAKAVAAHCDDPLVEYIHTRYVLMQQSGSSPSRLGDLFADCADHFEKTDYSSVRKMYADLRAAEMMKEPLGDSTNIPPRLTALKRAMVQHLNEALHDPGIPPSEAADITRQVWYSARYTFVARFDFEKILVPTLETLWKNQAFACVICGEFYVDKAWRARGGGYANTVTEEKWKGFSDYLDKAHAALQRAWVLDQKDVNIPIQMISVCMGLSLPRSTMETWFERAMVIDPNSYNAVEAKEFYLEPKWLGSDKEVIAFGRECVASKEWGGNVPLILQYIHHSLQKYYKVPEEKYFSSPEVWRDVSSSYERYFELNPRNVGRRHDYALDAYRAGQYQTFLDQLPRFTTGTNYQTFGGKAKFEQMVQTATMAK